MHRHSGVVILAVLLVIVAAAPIGCSRQRPSSDTAPEPAHRTATTGAPRADATVLELSEPKVTRLGPMAIRYEVTYRFTQGQPKAESWYTAQIELNEDHVGMKQIEGKDMQIQGTLRHDIRLLKDGARFRIQMVEAPSRNGPWFLVSNTVTGAVKTGS